MVLSHNVTGQKLNNGWGGCVAEMCSNLYNEV